MYIGNQPYQVAFVTDTFNGNGSTVAFTMSVAPANTSSVLVAVSGVLQDPSTYSVSGTTLTFTAAPPSGTGNISARYLGIPASGVTTTAYRTVTEFTATASQTTFTPPSYTVGFINVYRNGVLLGSADYTATNGTTVVLATGAAVNDLVTVESFLVSSVLNAIPATAGSVSDSYIVSMAASKLTGTQAIPKATLPTGSVLQVIQGTYATQGSTTSSSYVATGLSASITPSSATSKILVIVQGNIQAAASQNTNITLYRGTVSGTDLSGTSGGVGFSYLNAGTQITNSAPIISYLDSPATTSSTTYTFAYKVSGGATSYTNVGNALSTITLMEIAA